MGTQPLVSVIVPTRNSSKTLEACLTSISQQSYEHIELLVIDNNSTDTTKAIAKQYTKHVFNQGPERSAQRNYGADKATGQYVVFIDSDMELTPNVISACVTYAEDNRGCKAIIIPEESFGEGFWAQCKKLERSFYVGVEAIEAARFFEKELYLKLGGYDEAMVSGEDWDLSKRAAKITKIGRNDDFILHNEGRLKLINSLKKKYYYAGLSRAYMQKQNVQSKLTNSVGPIQRFKLFLSQPRKLFKNPFIGIGMLYMKTCEFGFGALGYAFSKQVESVPDKQILIISHANANSGAIDRYEDFLRRHEYKISKLTHPLDDYRNGESVYFIYDKQVWSRPRRELGTANLLIDFCINLKHLRTTKSTIIIGANNFDTCSAIFARRIFRKSPFRVIYFASDYSEQRFANPLLNSIYNKMERVALNGADLTISNTRRAEIKRLGLGLKPEKSVVVYNTAYIPDPAFPKKEINKNNFIYVGSLTKEHGLFNILNRCSSMFDQLSIIGDGPDRNRIIELCDERHIRIEYYGQKDHEWALGFMQNFSGIGLAPYNMEAARYVYYGSSLKLFEYLACGLPVITSNVTEQSQLIQKYNLGIVYSRLNEKSIPELLKKFSLNDFSKKSEQFYIKYNQEKLYEEIPI